MLDHILYPTLTESSFLTEVHHITARGDDGGVVYNEMRARENTEEELCAMLLLEVLYGRESGYASNTGGKLANLRALRNAVIKQYHADYYR